MKARTEDRKERRMRARCPRRVVSWRKFISASAMRRIRSAASGTISLYLRKSSGAGSGPEYCARDVKRASIADLWFCLFCGIVVHCAANVLPDALPVGSEIVEVGGGGVVGKRVCGESEEIENAMQEGVHCSESVGLTGTNVAYFARMLKWY